MALWLVWATLAWWVEPRSVSVDQLRADIASGQIVTYRVTGAEHPLDAWLPGSSDDSWDTLALDETTGLPKDHQPPATGIVYWVTSSYAQRRHLEASATSEPWQSLVGEMRAAGVPLEAPPSFQPLYGDTPFGPGWAAILIGLGSILLVYRPTRVTRWGWLWLTALVPFGLGLVALAVGELVRPSRVAVAAASVEAEEGPAERRLRGGRAFLLALVLSLLVGITARQLSQSIDALWMP